MPRVVPSQVMNLIERIFPQGMERHNLGRGNAGQLSALANLADEIPDELLTMDTDSYAGFVCSVAHIRHTLAAWIGDRSSRGNLDPIPGFPNESVVTLIQKALEKCPDEAPAPGTSELNFITDVDLRTNLRNDIGAIERALSNGEWKAATVLAGSTIEALLLWSLSQHPPAEITGATTGLRASGQLTRQPDPNLERWDLHEYTEVAANLGIIEADTLTETRLAREFRNLIHPGRAQRIGQKCDRGTARSSVAALDHVVRDLTP
jgi:hypothetical protein